MSRPTLRVFPALAILASLGGCGGAPSVTMLKSSLQRDTSPAASASDLASAATSARGFSVDLYKQLAPDKQNLFFSPHSIVEALMMTYVGARTETAAQMHDVLHLALSDAQENAAMNGLDLALASRAEGQAGTDGQPFRLAVANALWGQQGFGFQQPFLDAVATSYGGGLDLVDFIGATETARVEINDWVALQTTDKIQNLIPEGVLTDEARLVLTNAVYFDAAWAEPFDASATMTAPFTKTDGSSISVDTMTHESRAYGLYRAAGVTAVALPYAGDQLSMIVIRPDELAAFEADLDEGKLDAILDGLATADVQLHLPKWTFTDGNELGQPLVALGMSDAFGQADAAAPDFSGIDGKRDLSISEVVHKAFVEVDEAGTEAAAATAVVVNATDLQVPAESIDVQIDRPFLFLIRDDATGAVVFLGRVVDPSAG